MLDKWNHPNEAKGTESIIGENPDIAFRRDEFNVLRIPREDGQLLTGKADLEQYEYFVRDHFSNVILIHKLRETRAFAGFTRVYPHDGTDLGDRKKLLRRELPEGERDWLPAYVVFGEGVFIELDESRLRRWENRASVIRRVKRLNDQYQTVRSSQGSARAPYRPKVCTSAHFVTPAHE